MASNILAIERLELSILAMLAWRAYPLRYSAWFNDFFSYSTPRKLILSGGTNKKIWPCGFLFGLSTGRPPRKPSQNLLIMMMRNCLQKRELCLLNHPENEVMATTKQIPFPSLINNNPWTVGSDQQNWERASTDMFTWFGNIIPFHTTVQ